MAHIVATFAQYERRLIGQRTKSALAAAKKAQGVTPGRPRTMPTAVVQRIVTARDAGHGWSAIVRGLNDDAVPTSHGGARWHPSTVRDTYLGAAN